MTMSSHAHVIAVVVREEVVVVVMAVGEEVSSLS